MFAKGRLRELAEMRRLVVLQSEIHRGVLRLEGASLWERFAFLGPVSGKLRSHRALLVTGAALAGVLATRRWRSIAGWIPAGLTVWRWWRSFRSGADPRR